MEAQRQGGSEAASTHTHTSWRLLFKGVQRQSALTLTRAGGFYLREAQRQPALTLTRAGGFYLREAQRQPALTLTRAGGFY